MPNSNRVTPEQITALLDEAHIEEYTFHGKVLVADYQFPSRNGFTITGRAACVDPANFDLEIGRKIARADVEKQLWQLEGYLLQQKLAG
jgi:hypothetical protein